MWVIPDQPVCQRQGSCILHYSHFCLCCIYAQITDDTNHTVILCLTLSLSRMYCNVLPMIDTFMNELVVLSSGAWENFSWTRSFLVQTLSRSLSLSRKQNTVYPIVLLINHGNPFSMWHLYNSKEYVLALCFRLTSWPTFAPFWHQLLFPNGIKHDLDPLNLCNSLEQNTKHGWSRSLGVSLHAYIYTTNTLFSKQLAIAENPQPKVSQPDFFPLELGETMWALYLFIFLLKTFGQSDWVLGERELC